MDNTSLNGGSAEPIPTSNNPAAAPAAIETAAAQPGPAPQVLDAQPVSPSLIPQCEGLTSQQRIAVAALASGQSVAACARSAGVSGATLYRWRTKDPAFIAAVNAWRGQAQDAVRDRLLAMADEAAMAVFAAIRNGDAKMAMTLLKSLGAVSPTSRGPTTVDSARQDMDRQEWEQSVEIDKRRLEARATRRKFRADFCQSLPELEEFDRLAREYDNAEVKE
ncbi:MAG: Helix-turn-helix of insertion element transposase [Phycisphaerales bacterium]|nr:Helix-turn-helix of insertion element transposase [Phycisphaerales bacterium]